MADKELVGICNFSDFVEKSSDCFSENCNLSFGVFGYFSWIMVIELSISKISKRLIKK